MDALFYERESCRLHFRGGEGGTRSPSALAKQMRLRRLKLTSSSERPIHLLLHARKRNAFAIYETELRVSRGPAPQKASSDGGEARRVR
jgi:hypothetical protein